MEEENLSGLFPIIGTTVQNNFNKIKKVIKRLDCFVLQYTSKLVVKTTSMEVKRKNRTSQ